MLGAVLTPAQLRAARVHPSLIRPASGLEPADQLIAGLQEALA
jgi:cystathionine beta-lyase/cystathionine gamma-synthase